MAQATTQSGVALSRYKVLDLTQARAGPTCAKQLGDFGADVIRVEPPPATGREEFYAGDRDGADMQNLHRNKRSITIDLKSAEGLGVFLRLAESADVVIENFRPDVKHRLKIDYESLRKVNPRIILASISGFGQDGPYVGRPGFDQILQGMCGLMSVTGKPGQGPMRAGAAVLDMSTGWLAALGIMTALLEREQSGCGQWVQASLLHTGVALMDFQAARYLQEGALPVQVGNDHPTSMPTSMYATLDGYVNIAAAGHAMWTALCGAVERDDLVVDPRFCTDAARVEHRHELNEALASVFRCKRSDYWIEHLNAAGVPCGPVHTVDKVFEDPQVQHSGIAQTVTAPGGRKIRFVSQAIGLSRTPAQVHRTLGPKGEHTAEVLAEAGFDDAAIKRLQSMHII